MAHRPSATSSRPPPPMVAPVTIEGIRYAQRMGKPSVDGQAGGWLGAYGADGALLWSLKVYDNRRRDDLEGDVQDVFFRAMSVEPSGQLRITSESGAVFLVDVLKRTSTPLPRDPASDPGGIRVGG